MRVGDLERVLGGAVHARRTGCRWPRRARPSGPASRRCRRPRCRSTPEVAGDVGELRLAEELGGALARDQVHPDVDHVHRHACSLGRVGRRHRAVELTLASGFALRGNETTSADERPGAIAMSTATDRSLHDHLRRLPRRRLARSSTASTSRPSGSTSSTRGGASTRNPFRDLQDDGRARNWDDERRIADLEADGQVAEVTFPNTVPPFFPTGAVIARPPQDAEDYRRRWAGSARAQPLARRLVRPHPRRAAPASARSSSTTSTSRSPRSSGSHEQRPARAACSSPGIPDDADLAALLLRPLRPAVGGVRGARASSSNHHTAAAASPTTASTRAPRSSG